MKTYLHTIRSLCYLLFGLLCLQAAHAQVQIQSHVIPPYLNRIADYASHPELMVVTLTNTSTSEVQIQLTAKITGDNGISAWVKPGYRSPSPIVIQPGQTINLNGNDIAFLFDINKIEYTGISRADMTRGVGLLEGTYTMCIRALQYQTLQPISPDQPLGCTTFRISDLEPPRILSPFNEQVVDSKGVQAIPITWTTPPGSSPFTQYKVKLVEMVTPRNPNDALQTTTPLLETTVNSNMLLYGPSHPALVKGRKYAMVVQATDPTGRSNFRNRGLSEVQTFVYGANTNESGVDLSGLGKQAISARSALLSDIPDCGCKNVDNNQTAEALAMNDVVKIGDGSFEMTINNLNGSVADGYSGSGTVPLPAIGAVPGMKLRVHFAGLKANANKRMFEGAVRGAVNSSAPSVMPKTDEPDFSGASLSSDDIGQIDQFVKNNVNQVISQASSAANALGFELPMGIEKGPVTIAITAVYFNERQAWFNASTAMELPDAGPGQRLALSGRNFCMTSADFCGQGILALAEDLPLPLLDMTLLAATDNHNGTHIAFDAKGFKSFGILADYTFPNNTLVKASSPNEALTARLSATTETGWTNWVASVTVDPFQVTGIADFKFSLAPGKSIIYDHSDRRNATQVDEGVNMPNTLSFGNDQTLSFSPDWKGFYIPELQIELPAIIKNNSGTSPVFKATDFIFDTQRGDFSGKAGVANVLALNDGNLDGWYFSVDNINLTFFKNAFTGGEMDGKLMLPISGEKKANANANARKELTYDCTLTKPQGANIAFQFRVMVKNDLDFEAFWARASLQQGSNVLITAGGGQGFKAEATLNGALSITTDINGLPDVTLGHVAFANMKISSSGPTYFSPGQFSAGLGPQGNQASLDPIYDDEFYYAHHGPSMRKGPFAMTADGLPATVAGGGSQESLMGFNFTIKKWELYAEGGNIGLTFDTHMELVNGVNFVPKADLRFSIFAKPQNGLKRFWKGVGGKIEAVNLEVDADLAGMKIQGEIRYFDISSGPYKDRGFSGLLDVQLPIAQVKMKGMFGTRKQDGKQPFQFFYVDGLLDLKNRGIPMFPGTALYGFAGGAYYNMERAAPGNPFESINGASDPEERGESEYNTIKSFSGVEYMPISGSTHSSIGFMAGIYFGLESRAVLDAEVSLAIGFANGSFNQLSLQGRAAIMNDMSDSFEERFENSMINGAIGLDVTFKNGRFHIFDAFMTVDLKYPIVSPMITAHGSMAFRIEDGAGWYLKMGTPWNVPSPGPIELTLNSGLFKVGAKAYFQVGTMRIDDIPPVPTWISNIIDGANTRSEEGSRLDQAPKTMKDNRPKTEKESTKGFIAGLEVGFDADPQFLIFYAHLKAGLGADLSLKYYRDGPCANYTDAAWYAKGQAFVGAEASCGVRVNIFGIKKNIEFVSAGLAAEVTAGLPKPFYAKGRMGGYFSVLGGLISKNFRIGFEVGTVCESLGGNPEELALIDEIYPAEGEEINIFERPAVSFNYSLTNDFVVPLEYEDRDGMPYTVYQLFRFQRSDVTATLTGGEKAYGYHDFVPSGLSHNYDIGRGFGRDVYSIQLSEQAGMLKPESTYTLNVEAGVSSYKFAGIEAMQKGVMQQSKATMEAKANKTENFAPVISDNGQVYKDKRPPVKFKTGKGPKRIIVDNVAETFPYHRGNTTPYQAFQAINGNKGYLRLLIGQPGLPSYFDCDLRDNEAQVKVRFVTVEAGGNVTTAERDVRVLEDGKRWEFDMPTLLPNTAYAAKIYFKKISGAGSGTSQATSLVTRRSINLAAYGGGEVKISGRQLATNALRMSGGDHELFAWYFRTGQTDTYKNKYNNLRLLKTSIGGQEINRGQQQVNLDKLDWNPNERTKTLANIWRVEYVYTATEWFNKYDFTYALPRNTILPAVSNTYFTANKEVIWPSLMERSGMNPYHNHIELEKEKAMWKDFVRDAFGADKTLNIEFHEFEGVINAVYGMEPIRAHSSVSFPNYTRPLATNMYDINFDENQFSSPEDQSGSSSSGSGSSANTGSSSGSTSTTETYLHAIENVGNYVGNINMSVGASNAAVNSMLPALVVAYQVSGGQSIGKGVMNNAYREVQRVITLKKDQGYPTDIFYNLPGIGNAMDKVHTSLQNTPTQIQAPMGLQGTQVTVPPLKAGAIR